MSHPRALRFGGASRGEPAGDEVLWTLRRDGIWWVAAVRHSGKVVLTAWHKWAAGWVRSSTVSSAYWEGLTVAEKEDHADALVERARAQRAGVNGLWVARDAALLKEWPTLHAFMCPSVSKGGELPRGAVMTVWTDQGEWVVKLLDTLTELSVTASGGTFHEAAKAVEALLSSDRVPWRAARPWRGKRR